MTTVGEAREALLAFVVASPEKVAAYSALIDTLIAAVRAEYDHLPRCEHGAYREPCERCRADADAKMRALVERT